MFYVKRALVKQTQDYVFTLRIPALRDLQYVLHVESKCIVCLIPLITENNLLTLIRRMQHHNTLRKYMYLAPDAAHQWGRLPVIRHAVCG